MRVAFFFSSRRRHTSCGRDWSSDVCSSDLFLQVTRCHTCHPVVNQTRNSSSIQTVARHLLLVHINFQLGTVLIATDGDVAGSRHLFTDGATDLLSQQVGLVKIVAIDLYVHRSRSTTHSARNGSLVVNNLRISFHLLTKKLGNIKHTTLPFLFIGKHHRHCNLIVRGRVKQRRNTPVVTRPGRSRQHLYFRSQLHKALLQTTGSLQSLLHPGTPVQLNTYRHTSLVALLHKISTNQAKKCR